MKVTSSGLRAEGHRIGHAITSATSEQLQPESGQGAPVDVGTLSLFGARRANRTAQTRMAAARNDVCMLKQSMTPHRAGGSGRPPAEAPMRDRGDHRQMMNAISKKSGRTPGRR